MKISVMANGMVKVEGATLAEEVEMRNKLQSQGKTCTPIEYEGSLQACLNWIMGKSESELDEVKDNDEDDDIYILEDEDGQELEIEINEVVDYIKDEYELDDLDYSDVEEAVQNYLWERPEISEDDFYYLLESTNQVEELTDKVYDRL